MCFHAVPFKIKIPINWQRVGEQKHYKCPPLLFINTLFHTHPSCVYKVQLIRSPLLWNSPASLVNEICINSLGITA